ncbi:polypeptide N-acetylgalactosaminyltransferase 13-like [Haliotis rufescens]|uniref:polypeptide N-acetylgalactosaminyltransferase 13-like n=1 Tax=Haliotis rufescens TaxID=6454 RepID=UPI00201EF51B|nr:polypeptide N-acetylgalactosaminyltransferase 13-like [Haliotis rufescens]XP_046378145.2 polypeptide N-acetylgalactosaminyltransferase 13-like [Haliotis rufescens]XP_046378146.2 polypeptide N-acetylgalactosaminyltransferase 13-like [Haliotis rufescens]
MRKYFRLIGRFFLIALGITTYSLISGVVDQGLYHSSVSESDDKGLTKRKGDQFPRENVRWKDLNVAEMNQPESAGNLNDTKDKIRQQLDHIHLLNKLKEFEKGDKIKGEPPSDVKRVPGVVQVSKNKEVNMEVADLPYPSFVKYSPENGPGEYGVSYIPELNATEKKVMDKMFRLHYFNVYVSDRISVHRRLLDTRSQECKDKIFRTDLPMASVIICFKDEAWSVLLRTVHSILDRSPSHLLQEIILVDDFSSSDHLKGPLDRYMSDYPLVKILRTTKREGLTRARLMGYEVAQGPVLVFLDSHVECFPGWLEPLLDRIAENPTNVPFPHIPYIDKDHFGSFASMDNQVGIFNWQNLIYTWIFNPEKVEKLRKSTADPLRSATMPGGLFAIDRNYFTTLGTYDPELLYWGGENMELSFKVWMCNGTIELIPCSQVGHIFRHQNPIKWRHTGNNVVNRNCMRVAEVWMDDYKEFVYDASFPRADFGDISDRKRLRESLRCHDFRWYMKNVFPFPEPVKSIAAGEIRNVAKPICLDSMGTTMKPGVFGCHGQGQNQWWQVREDGTMGSAMQNMCHVDGTLVLKEGCPEQSWSYDKKNQTLLHSPSNMCLQVTVNLKLTLDRCSGTSWQKWIVPLKDKQSKH